MKMFFSSLGVGPYKNIFKKKNFITSHHMLDGFIE